MLEELNNKKLLYKNKAKHSSNSLGQSPKIQIDTDISPIENSSSNKNKDKKKPFETKDSLGRKLHNFKNNYQGNIILSLELVDLLKNSEKSNEKIKSKQSLK